MIPSPHTALHYGKCPIELKSWKPSKQTHFLVLGSNMKKSSGAQAKQVVLPFGKWAALMHPAILVQIPET